MAPIEEIFCEIADFCKVFFPQFEQGLLPAPTAKRRRALSMSASEIMTIVILFHLSHYRDFKNFYLDSVLRQMGGYFSNAAFLQPLCIAQSLKNDYIFRDKLSDNKEI